jgi:hypothetical protein
MVRAAKEALVAVLGRQRLTYKLLITTLTHVENVLNSRKLTPPSDDPTDPEALTPNHFLLGRANPNVPPDVFGDDDLTARERWRIAQALSEKDFLRSLIVAQ